MTHAIDRFLALPAWRASALGRLVPLADAIRVERHAAGDILFSQLHPADRFAFLVNGAVAHETSEDVDREAWPMGHIDWPWAALGWSSFLPPFRYGTTARALTKVELLTWSREDLDRVFYADPTLAIDFLRLVLDSMRCQFEALRNERLAGSRQQSGWAVRSRVQGPMPHCFAPGLLTTLRRSAFFQLFD